MNYKILLTILTTSLLASMFLISCEKEEEEVWGETIIGFSIEDEHLVYAPAEVQFINNTKNAESYLWTFPQGRIMEGDRVTQDSVTSGIQPDGVFYALPGDYTAQLWVYYDGNEELYEKTFEVKKPNPEITVYPEGGIVYDDTVTFGANFLQLPGMEEQVTYNWDFGNGETSTEPNPQTSFNPPGIYTVSLELFDGEETLHATRDLVIQAEIAKAIYYADAKNNTIYRKMLYSDTELEHENLFIDLDKHPLSVNIWEERIVVNIAGENIRYADEDTPADGYIFTTNLDGGDRYTITSTGPEHDYRDDPFVGDVAPDGTVYWLDRFNGGRKMHISEQDAEYPEPFVFDFASEGSELAEAIGVVSAYGWTDGAIRYVDGELWYSKHGTGRGLYRFTPEGDYIDKIEPLFDYKIRTFEVDLENGKIFFAINIDSGGKSKGLYRCNLDGTNIELIDDLPDFSDQGGESERAYVTELVIDSDGGYIYYPFRHEEDWNIDGEMVGDGNLSGIKRWKMDGSGEPEFYVTGVIPFGIGIDHVKR